MRRSRISTAAASCPCSSGCTASMCALWWRAGGCRRAAHPALRAELEVQAERDGPAALHARLQQLDPEAAARIDRRCAPRGARAGGLFDYRTALFGAACPGCTLLPRVADRPDDRARGAVRTGRPASRRDDRRWAGGQVRALVARGYGLSSAGHVGPGATSNSSSTSKGGLHWRRPWQRSGGQRAASFATSTTGSASATRLSAGSTCCRARPRRSRRWCGPGCDGRAMFASTGGWW